MVPEKECRSHRVAGKTGYCRERSIGDRNTLGRKISGIFHRMCAVDDPQLTVYVIVDEPNVENQETQVSYSMIISEDHDGSASYLNIPQTEEITQMKLLQGWN